MNLKKPFEKLPSALIKADDKVNDYPVNNANCSAKVDSANVGCNNEANLPSPFIKLDNVMTGIPFDTGKIEEAERTFTEIPTQNKSTLNLSSANSYLEIADYNFPKIYKPKPIETEQFKKNILTIENVVNGMKQNYVLRSYCGELYLLGKNPDKFQVLDGRWAETLIDEYLKKISQFRDANFLKLVKESLICDSTIAVREKTLLPFNLVAFRDGLIDIYSGNRIMNYGNYFYTSCLSCKYVPEASCPIFDDFLDSCAGGDQKLIERIWQIIGYILTDDMNAKAFFTFLGPKDTGKSLLANVIAELLDKSAVRAMAIEEFGRTFTLYELLNTRLAICMDIGIEPLSSTSVATIKKITGGDLVRAEGKYKEAVTARIPAKILFGSNSKIKCTDAAFLDREIIVPFNYPIPKAQQDKMLFNKLCCELPGIAVKALEAYKRLVANNYIFAEISEEILLIEDLSAEKIITEFVNICCDLSDPMARTHTEDLHSAYIDFCIRKKLPALEMKRFSGLLNVLFPQLKKQRINMNKKNLNGFSGIQVVHRKLGV